MRNEKGSVAMIGLGALIVVVIIGGIFMMMYNGLIKADENINGEWAQVENQLQRRFDLIPNLVETAKAYAKHEEQVFTDIANARAAYGNAETVEEQAAANDELGSALERLLVIVESYPELKANEQYKALMDELAGTENRIAVARMDYNDAVKDFNGDIRTFPKSIFASMIGLEQRAYFEANDEAAEAPKVDFGEE